MRNRIFIAFAISFLIHATFMSLLVLDFEDVNLKRLLPNMEISPAAVEIVKNPDLNPLEKTKELVQLFLDSLKDPTRLAKEKIQKMAEKTGGFDPMAGQGKPSSAKKEIPLSLPTGEEVAQKVAKVVKEEVKEFIEEMGKIKTSSKKKDKGEGDEKGFKSFVEITTVSTDNKKSIEEKTVDSVDPDSLAEAMYIKQQEDCKKNPKTLKYGGVGLSFKFVLNKQNPQDYYSEVDIVPRGYPARKAGMRKGDIVRGNVMRFRGPIGSEVLVDFERNGSKQVLKMTRAEICYIPENNPAIPFKQSDKKRKH